MLHGTAKAIIANAGNANACTGEQGMQDARQTARWAAEGLGIETNEVLVASTGVIGAPLNMEAMKAAIPSLIQGLSRDGLPGAARGIMTTDSFAKLSLFEGKAGKSPYRIAGTAKGAGMIMPDMATMLCFIISDIAMDRERLRQAVSRAVNRTFNRISVDGDTSTNDTVLVLANGAAGNPEPDQGEFEAFEKGLTGIMEALSSMIVQDGEGATKLVRLKVEGAASAEDAFLAARTIANSSLVKTAFFGQDPNWGRIMAALGRSGIGMQEQDVDIFVDDIQIVKGGLGLGAAAEKKAAERMTNKTFGLRVDLHQGPFEDRMTTCDLTHEYVSINADYRT
jgi:glutamate N-acetyltransferase/amino-acid N-acetyltransferase